MRGALHGQRERRAAAAAAEEQQQPPARPPPPRRQQPRLQPPKGGRGSRRAHFPADFRSVCGFTCQAIKMMSMNSKQPHFAMHPTLPEHKYPSLHSSSEAIRRACLPTPPVSAPRPRLRPARLPPPRLRDTACRVLMRARSRCWVLRAGIFRGIPRRGTFCPVALNVVFPSPLPRVGRLRSEWEALGP